MWLIKPCLLVTDGFIKVTEVLFKKKRNGILSKARPLCPPHPLTFVARESMLELEKGGLSVAIWYRMQPAAQTSAFSP